MNYEPKRWMEQYKTEAILTLNSLPFDDISVLIDGIRETVIAGHQIFIFGNGGSAANASHFAMELAKNVAPLFGRVRVTSLNDNVPWITAIANDTTYNDIFLHQLQSLSVKGDLAIILSTGGRSQNVVKPAEWAKQHGVETICIVGNRLSDLQQFCDHSVVIHSIDSGHIEDMQHTIIHMVVDVFAKQQQYGIL